MATIDDKASDLEELFRDMALREQALKALKPTIQPNGTCHLCGEDDPDYMPYGALFCCPDCQSDYEHLERMRRIAGRV